MTRYIDAETAAALGARRTLVWRAYFPQSGLLTRIAAMARTWLQRRQQRQELLDYMALDHRADGDIGISRSDALDWAHRPFWRR